MVEERENLNVLLGILIRRIEPKLVKFIHRGFVGVEPNVPAFGFTEFRPVGFGNQRGGQRECFRLDIRVHAAHEFGSGGDVAPLVATAHLQHAIVMFVQVVEIVALDELVGELGKRHTVAGFTTQTLLDRVLGHHIIHGNSLAYFTRKVDEREILHPVVVVHHNRREFARRIKIQKSRQHTFNPGHILSQSFLIEQIAFV